MRIQLAAAAALVASAVATAAHAAPLQAVARVAPGESGNVTVTGFSGEIYFGLWTTEEKLRRSNYLLEQHKDNFVPGQLHYLWLGGVDNFVANMGDVLWPGHPRTYYEDVRIVYQSWFTSPITELPPTFVAPGFQPPPGVEGFWVTALPEPKALGIMLSSLITLACSRRRPTPSLATLLARD
jgi:hypothetical protein